MYTTLSLLCVIFKKTTDYSLLLCVSAWNKMADVAKGGEWLRKLNCQWETLCSRRANEKPEKKVVDSKNENKFNMHYGSIVELNDP